MNEADARVVEVKLEMWKKTIDVQMHFNELEMKIRNFAVLLISAFIGGAGLALKEGMTVDSLNVSLASVLLYSAAFLTIVFYLADRFWYHPLLLGSVIHGMAVEKSLAASGFSEASLTHAVGDASGVKLLFTDIKIRSSKKIAIFYMPMFLIFAVLGYILQDAGSKQEKIKVSAEKEAEAELIRPSSSSDTSRGESSMVTINLSNNHTWDDMSKAPKASEQYLESCLKALSREQLEKSSCAK